MEYKILKIYEDDYGCEGVPEDQEPMCSVLVQNSFGEKKWIKLSDSYLSENYINIGSMIKLPE